jgi:CheY-like chemotaxis protein
MSSLPNHQILVVDDEPSVRETVALLLQSKGYDVTTAENGYAALLRLRKALPKVIVSDLNMPQMSGLEFLSVVRRRFPQVLLVAMSGAYDSEDAVPGGVIADAFYAKGKTGPQALLQAVAKVIRTSASRTNAHGKESAPVLMPRNGKDANGLP